MLRMFVLTMGLLVAMPAWAQSSAIEDEFWGKSRNQGDQASYNAYLENYPAGRYASLAFRCVIELSLMTPGHDCSVNQTVPGPLGPVSAKIGNFPVSMR